MEVPMTQKNLGAWLLAALIISLSGCDQVAAAFDISRDDSAPAAGSSAGPDDDEPLPQRAKDLFADATPLTDALLERFARDLRIKEVVVYATRARITVQVPGEPLQLDEYAFDDGHLGEAKPVKIFGGKPTEASMRRNTFAASDADFSKLARILKDAPRRVPGKVTHAMLKRGLPFHNEVRWRVYLDAPRSNGSVEYDLAGNVIKVWD
jgi:hypothetical protein